MNIVPISSMSMLQNSPIAQNKNVVSGTELPFQDFLTQALANVEETNTVKDEDSYALAVGDVDNLAEVFINSSKADIALTMFVEMRNKLLDAYSEIMRMSV